MFEAFMDSTLHGVPLSATQMTPKAAPSISGIRAPLTVDESDFEYSVSSSKGHRNSTTSSYYSESEGFASGEDEFDPDEDVLEETHFVKKYSFSRPFVKNPSEKNVEESSDSDEFGVSRSSVKDPNENFHNESGNVGKNAILLDFVQESSNNDEVGFSRPFVKSPDEVFPKVSGIVGGNGIFRPFVRSPDERAYKGISSDNDSGDTEDEGVEDEDYVSKKSNLRPLVAVMDDEVSESEQTTPVMDIKIIAKITGDSDDDSQGSEIYEDVGFSVIARIPSVEVLHRVNSAPKVRISEVDEVDDSELEDESVVEMEFVDDFGVSNGHKDEKDHVSSDMIQDEGLDAYKGVEVDCLVENDEHCSTSEIEQKREAMSFNETIQETVLIDDGRKCVDLVNHVGPVDLSDSTIVDDNFVFDRNIESEKLESEDEQKIEFFSPTFSSKIESFDQGVDIKEVVSDVCPQFSDLSKVVIENDQIDMCNSLLKDTELDSEARNEVENSKQLSEPVLDISSNSLLDGEVSKDHVGDIEREIVRDSDEERISDCGQIIDMGGDSVKFTTYDAIGNLSLTDVGPTSHLVSNVDLFEDIEREIVRGSNEGEISDCGQISDMDCDSVKFTASDGIGNLSLTDVGPTSPLVSSVDLDEALSEGEKTVVKKIQHIRVKYLRLLDKLGRSPQDDIAAKVLNKLTIAEASYSSRASNLCSSKKASMDENDLDFSLTILVFGKTGVGKSATINSLFGETKSVISAFEPTTNKVKEIIGTINGVKVKIFDTPGLRASIMDQSINRRILSSIKKVIKKSKPDIILYVDRLDAQKCNLDDLHVVKMITSCLGSSMWRKCIIVLTHATSIPPDGPDGSPLSHETFVGQCYEDFRKLINRSSLEMRMVVGPGSMIVPLSLVENHPFDKNGESWRMDMILLCYSMKILSELNSTVTIDSPSKGNKPFGVEGILVQKNESPETISLPLSDMTIPTSFSGKNPSFRYQFLECSSARPVFDSHDGVVMEGKIVISGHLSVGAGLKDKFSGQICVKIRCSDQLQIAALAFVPIAKAIFKKVFRQNSNEDHLI